MFKIYLPTVSVIWSGCPSTLLWSWKPNTLFQYFQKELTTCLKNNKGFEMDVIVLICCCLKCTKYETISQVSYFAHFTRLHPLIIKVSGLDWLLSSNLLIYKNLKNNSADDGWIKKIFDVKTIFGLFLLISLPRTQYYRVRGFTKIFIMLWTYDGEPVYW